LVSDLLIFVEDGINQVPISWFQRGLNRSIDVGNGSEKLHS